MSSQAVGYMLNKARHFTDSALFSRSGNGMVPDNVARNLAFAISKYQNENSPDPGTAKNQNGHH